MYYQEVANPPTNRIIGTTHIYMRPKTSSPITGNPSSDNGECHWGCRPWEFEKMDLLRLVCRKTCCSARKHVFHQRPSTSFCPLNESSSFAFSRGPAFCYYEAVSKNMVPLWRMTRLTVIASRFRSEIMLQAPRETTYQTKG